MLGIWQYLRREHGFTLVETIVVMAILLIVLGVIATSLTFAFRMMTEERTLSNADTLNATVRNSIEDALRYADIGTPTEPAISIGTDSNGIANGKITFTTKQNSSYRKAGKYTISNGIDGQIQITSGETSGALLPSPTYIDGDTVTCTFAIDGDTILITTTVTCSAGKRTVDSYMDVLNG